MDEGRVLVVGPEDGLLPTLTEEIARHQHDVRDVALRVGSSSPEVHQALSGHVRDRWVEAVVWTPLDGDLGADLGADLGVDDRWDERCEGPLLDGLHVAQAALELLEAGGRLIFVLPDVGVTGAAGQVPLATAVEGLRALAKSAGRQWAERGITTATILTPSDLEEVDVQAVADVVSALLGPAGAALTGVTLPVDGGTLMLP